MGGRCTNNRLKREEKVTGCVRLSWYDMSEKFMQNWFLQHRIIYQPCCANSMPVEYWIILLKPVQYNERKLYGKNCLLNGLYHQLIVQFYQCLLWIAAKPGMNARCLQNGAALCR